MTLTHCKDVNTCSKINSFEDLSDTLGYSLVDESLTGCCCEFEWDSPETAVGL